MEIPLLDLKAQYSSIKEEIDKAIRDVLDKGQFILGRYVQKLEEEVARYSDVKYGIGVASGTDALILALTSLGIGRGDEIITTPFTFIATAEAISRVGARPVFVDIEPRTYNIAPDRLEEVCRQRARSKKLRAILPVHLYGNPCEMNRILKIANKYKLKVIEDAAQAIGAKYKTHLVGGIGNIGCFSFFPSKNLGGFGDGGMVVTNDKTVADKVRILRVHGSSAKYHHSLIGFNSRLDSLQAAILSVKLKKLNEWIVRKRGHARFYNEELKDVVIIPYTEDWTYPVYQLYVIRIKDKRDSLLRFLQEKGIGSRVYYPVPLHLQKCYKDLGYKEGDFPEAESASRETLALPIYPELTEVQREYVVKAVREFFKNY
jgi:dTDP-4-amino-4,6-dideoxygalactose transaminase